MSYFSYPDLISSFLDPKLVDLGSTLIHVGAYGPMKYNIDKHQQSVKIKNKRKNHDIDFGTYHQRLSKYKNI